MRFDKTFLRSKVGRRIFLLFISCALLPTIALAILSFNHVARQLKDQSHRRLHRASKASAMAIAERVVTLENEMKIFAANVWQIADTTLSDSTSAPVLYGAYIQRLKTQFRAMAVVTETGGRIQVLGSVRGAVTLNDDQRSHLRSGRPVLITWPETDGSAGLRMVMALDPARPHAGLLVADVAGSYMWGQQEESPPPHLIGACVFEESGDVLFSSLRESSSIVQLMMASREESHAGYFEWKGDGETYLASYWVIFFRSMYRSPNWTVVVSESKSNVLAPMRDFRNTFQFVIITSIWVVLLVSIVLIRRSLVPLERLREGTESLAAGRFDRPVEVTSGDEFAEVAESFNTMARRLARQFNVLTTITEIDRAILSSLDRGRIIQTVLREVPNVFICDGITVIVLKDEAPGDAGAFGELNHPEVERFEEPVFVSHSDIHRLKDNPESLVINAGTDPPPYLAPLSTRGLKSFWVLPLFLKKRLSGILALGYQGQAHVTHDEIVQGRRLVDQLAVALTNAQLVLELDRLNVGTLTALARAIDAKSPWTRGHSERVTSMALKIGRKMDLDMEQLHILHRGGLLHDIGKLATPQEILDKPGKLTDEEIQVIRDHVRHGERILEPIPAFKGLMPIVVQHHERYDGKGYPAGLAGKDIDQGARIFAVADCYDAVISDRPYRPALSREEAMQVIKDGSGTAFDPDVVEAFLQVIEEETSSTAPYPLHIPSV